MTTGVGTTARGIVERFVLCPPDVFPSDGGTRLWASFVGALSTGPLVRPEAGQHANVHLYLQGLLSHLPGKNAEGLPSRRFVDVQRQVVPRNSLAPHHGTTGPLIKVVGWAGTSIGFGEPVMASVAF